jgi:hypothetical protein
MPVTYQYRRIARLILFFITLALNMAIIDMCIILLSIKILLILVVYGTKTDLLQYEQVLMPNATYTFYDNL